MNLCNIKEVVLEGSEREMLVGAWRSSLHAVIHFCTEKKLLSVPGLELTNSRYVSGTEMVSIKPSTSATKIDIIGKNILATIRK